MPCGVLAGKLSPVHTSPLPASRMIRTGPALHPGHPGEVPHAQRGAAAPWCASSVYCCGRASHFRLLVAQMRLRLAAEAYLRLRTLAAEQAQVDGATSVICPSAEHGVRGWPS